MNPTNDLRVLVVDDDFRVAALHASYVDEVPGFTALTPVHDARMVPRVVAEEKPDLLLLDVYLPQGSGLDLLATLDVDAFVLSAATEADAVRTAIRRGALGYLVKPFDPKLLAARLRSYARYRRQLDSATVLDQGAIDRAQRTLLAGDDAGTAVPTPTEQAVLAAVAATGEPATVMQVATAVGISRATAQRYLATLVQAGSLRLELTYGSRGRPEHRYLVQG
ncbi:response regulator [Paeniglutamicibacter sp. NPDC012692]|uniref:response regulator n=1 Tax=Paeniglutamicibacter sp. NPDC012692 TaxID=3364388 RepID=UPI0036B098B5